ncbi:conserved hypothetical protein [Neospora caninum Liverpool]|uniref:Mediator complex subunit MED17 n=1 Tax=Neospora caninum (strain Liverpool) TaxID=572307 RepID=F0VQ82_NEOCL|nr:conserved hypothetical protein [Neospora caninum Liverpool]CBZ55879.1 conserved hypothetical protein [Neospora caninum Liverpool]CEL70622.1 TPA: mediator complex subunit MED17 [Neospora caninum Liverpool]|eukprot:XP_003885905.1 conserved hypothetical protein [Neospora caninum Liverpool]
MSSNLRAVHEECSARPGKREAAVGSPPARPSSSCTDGAVASTHADTTPTSARDADASPQFSLEPYGAGDLRLLKFLADGRPVWEAPPARPPGGMIAADADFFFPEQGSPPAPGRRPEEPTLEATQLTSPASPSLLASSLVRARRGAQAERANAEEERANAEEERANAEEERANAEEGHVELPGSDAASVRAEAFRAYLEKAARASAAYPPLDLLQRAEALCVEADARHQEQLKASDPWVKNKGAWDEAVQKRDEASKWLSGAGMLFDLLLGTANAAPGQRFLRLVEAKDEVDEEEMWQKLLIGLHGRREMSLELETQIADARHQMLRTPAGLPGQRTWVNVLRRLQTLRWVLVKKRYQDVEFSQSDASYPYVSEVYVHLLQIPSRCWGAMVSTVGCSLPLPPPRVFGDHFVLLKATLKDQTDEQTTAGRENAAPQRQTTCPWGFVLEYDEQASAAVETRSLLHINVRPLLSSHLLAGSSTRFASPEASSSPPSSLFPRPSTCLPSAAGLLVDETPAVSSPPSPLSDTETKQEAEVTQVANAIHRRLQKAQWCLLDRCCFHVLAAQAERMRVLGERSATAVASRTSEGRFPGGEDANGSNVDAERLRRRITSECLHVDSKRIRILLRGVPMSPRYSVQAPVAQASGEGGDSTDTGRRSNGIGNGVDVAMSDGAGTSDNAAVHSHSALPPERRISSPGCKCAVHTLDFVVDIAYLPSDVDGQRRWEETGVRTSNLNQGTGAQSSTVFAEDVSRTGWRGTARGSEGNVERREGNAEAPAHSTSNVVRQRCSLCRCCSVCLHEATGALFEQAQKVAVLQLRQFFLETWEYEAFEHPKLCGELAFPPPLLHFASPVGDGAREGPSKAGRSAPLRGEDFLLTFVSWLASEGLDFV